jgi:hypothetical protein
MALIELFEWNPMNSINTIDTTNIGKIYGQQGD